MKGFFICLIFFCLLGLGIFIWQGIYFPQNPNLTESQFFLIEKGQNLFEIGENLEKEGLIKDKIFFDLCVLIKGKVRSLQAGEYSLSPAISIAEVVEKIISGEVIKEKITIIEGWNLRDIGWYFENKGMFQAEELYGEMRELEGYLFPDTYEIKKGTSLEEIVRKMLANFNKKLTLDLRKEIEGQGKTIFEIVTMASLLEKEVKTFEDKKLASGILWKRLKNNLPLQVDATITYITGKKTIKISKEETQIDSPYNTYKYLGLPLGPISNPGLESIMAALYPIDSDYWYYLSIPAASPNGREGETIFSKTLEEHNIAKAKYLKFTQ